MKKLIPSKINTKAPASLKLVDLNLTPPPATKDYLGNTVFLSQYCIFAKKAQCQLHDAAYGQGVQEQTTMQKQAGFTAEKMERMPSPSRVSVPEL